MSGRWKAVMLAGALVAPAVLAGCGGSPAASNGNVRILETGSSLLYPLFNEWQAAYKTVAPAVHLTTQSTGSGTGITDATKGLAQIGASDAYLSNQQASAYPNILNIPLAISAQQINYNLPGLNKTHLKLSGPVLAGIYTGQITNWDSAKIAALNPGVALPNHTIVPVVRSDGSGDTFLFTTYLSKSAASIWTAGYSTTVSWPAVTAELSADGNQGVEQAVKETPYSVGYIGISYLSQAISDGLGYAALENEAGNFVLPTATDIQAAVRAAAGDVPKDERISLVFSAGTDSYPIINFEYAMVNRHQSSVAMANALKALLTWALNPQDGSASKFLTPVHFQPLPQAVVTLSQAQIAEIAG